MSKEFLKYDSLGQHPYVNEEIASDIEKDIGRIVFLTFTQAQHQIE